MFGAAALLLIVAAGSPPAGGAIGSAHTVSLGRYRFDPQAGLPDVPAALAAAGDPAASGLHLVQLAGPIDPAWRASLGAAAEVLDYVPDHAYLVWLEPGRQAALASRPEVRAIVPLAPALKLTEGVFALLASSRSERIALGLHRGDRLDDALARLGAAGAVIESHQALLGQELVIASAPGTAIPALARDPEVISISPWPDLVPEGEVAKRIIDGSSGAGPSVAPPGYRAFLAGKGVDGSGVTLGVIDTGVDVADPSGHLNGRVASVLRGAPEGSDGHGHHVAGIAAGDCNHPADASGYLWGLGVAPGAGVLNLPRLRAGYTGTDLDAARDVVTTPAPGGVKGSVASCSWGTLDPGVDYTMLERQWDAIVRDADGQAAGDQPLVVSFSSGNNGPGPRSLTRPHAGKNLIAVGSVVSYRPEYGALDFNALADSSSRGPAGDGRIKPDLVAPGGHVVSAQVGGFACTNDDVPIDALHVSCSGTSMAQPHVAGAALLFIDAWQQDHAGVRPSPALVKAALVNGTHGLAPVAAGPPASAGPVPNPGEGWGLLDLDASIRPSLPALDSDQGIVLAGTGERSSRTFALADPSRPLKVTLAWTDPPAAVGASPALVNDLDLTLSKGLGGTWPGNRFKDGWSDPAATGADRLNNLENVFLEHPGEDLYTVDVVAANLAGDGVPSSPSPTDQDFALVIANAELAAAAGKVRLLAPVLACGRRAEVLVYDSGLALSVTVRLASGTEPLGEPLALAETAPGSGFFRGGIDLGGGLPAPDGVLQVADGDTVTVTYVDADDGQGGRDVTRTAAAPVDCRAPRITSVRVVSLDDHHAVIAWDTDEAASSEVTLVVPAARTVASGALVTAHGLVLDGLEPCATYRFYVASADAALNRAEDRNAGALYTFTTAGKDDAFLADFEGDDGGFTHFGPLEEWEWGAPLYGPPAAASGDRLFATDLDGKYAKLGRAAPNGDFSLLSPAIDLAGRTGSRLRMNLWFDIATDGSTDDGAWVEVWDAGGWVFIRPEGGYGGTVDDNAPRSPESDGSAWAGSSDGWRQVEFDLSRFDGRVVQVRIRLFEEDAFLAGSAGLYVDDFEVFAYGDCKNARLHLPVPAAGCDRPLAIEAWDAAANLDPEAIDTLVAGAWSTSEPSGEAVPLTETGPDTARFTAALPTGASTGVGDGRLTVKTGDRVTIAYRGARVDVPADCTAPRIGAVAVEALTDRSAEVAWRTDEPATSRVEFGATPALGSVVDDRTLTTRHRVKLLDLAPCTRYSFRTSSADLAGGLAIEDPSIALRAFDTLEGHGLAFADDFETDRGWTLDGEWERDTPRGLQFVTSTSMDPNAAVSRDRVLGIDLTGLGTQPGNYEPSVPLEKAVSPPIDASALGSVELSFARWLGVDSSSTDRAVLELSNDGGQSWSPVWQNPASNRVGDLTWKPQSFDVSALAAGRPDVRVRFTLSSDAMSESMGWQVDDLTLRDPGLPPYRACGSTLRYSAHRIDDSGGNGDGAADPGETVRVPIRLANDGVAAARGVTAKVASGRPDLGAFAGADLGFPDIVPGSSAESNPPHVDLAVSPAARCGSVIPVSLSASSADAAASSGFGILVGPGPTRTLGYAAAAPSPIPIPDPDPAGVALAVDVTDDEPVVALAVTVDVTHPRAGDLVVTLTSPSGDTITLHDFTGGTAPYALTTYPPAPIDGPGDLVGLAGASARGRWTLRVADAVVGFSGSLKGFTIQVTAPDPAGGVSGAVASPLKLVRSGADLVATFGSAPGAVAYVLEKAARADLGDASAAATSRTPDVTASGEAGSPGSYYYDVRGLDACGRRGP